MIGGGSWGQAFAVLAAQRGMRTTLVCRTQAQAATLEMNRDDRYLPGVVLAPEVRVTHLGDSAATDGASLVALAVPSRATADVVRWLVPRVRPGAGILSLTKGLDPRSGRRLSEVWRDALPAATPFAVLTGPNHAEEVATGQPTAAVVAGDDALCEDVQGRLTGGRFRVYVNDDLLGVELSAAAKNVIAIAAGMSDGLGFGDNAKASLITRGLAEMTRLGVAHGAHEATYRGLAGMGDLIATCTSRHSRNRMAGQLIAEGLAPSGVEERLGQVAEGLDTVRNLLRVADGANVELPIATQVAAAAFDGVPVEECVDALMNRAPAAEH